MTLIHGLLLWQWLTLSLKLTPPPMKTTHHLRRRPHYRLLLRYHPRHRLQQQRQQQQQRNLHLPLHSPPLPHSLPRLKTRFSQQHRPRPHQPPPHLLLPRPRRHLPPPLLQLRRVLRLQYRLRQMRRIQPHRHPRLTDASSRHEPSSAAQRNQ